MEETTIRRKVSEINQSLASNESSIKRALKTILNLEENSEKLRLENSLLKELIKKREVEDQEKTKKLQEKIQYLESIQINRLPEEVQAHTNSLDSYDAVINIPNIKELLNGWSVTINDWNEYQNLAKRSGTIVSVIGNPKTGKTFLLELLTKTKFIQGSGMNNQRISIYYSKVERSKKDSLTAIDTNISNNPIQINNNFERDGNIAQAQLKRNKMEERLRDRSVTEELFQNFMLEISNIIIVVVSDLTFDDQKLVNKLMSKYKADASKKMIVVHNLYNIHYITDVEAKIEDVILPSFIVEEVAYKSVLNENNNQRYFVETSRGKVPHLIIAKQHSEAGDFYNLSSIKYTLDCLNSNDNNEPIDIIQSLHKYLQREIQKYINFNLRNLKENLKIKTDDDGKPTAIYVENIEAMEIKEVETDVFEDIKLFKKSLSPNYMVNKETIDGTSYLFLKIECPDFCNEVKTKIIHLDSCEFFIQVKGTKNQKAEGEIIFNNRKCGDFFIKTTNLKKSTYGIYYDLPPTKTYENGMFILRWTINEEEELCW